MFLIVEVSAVLPQWRISPSTKRAMGAAPEEPRSCLEDQPGLFQFKIDGD